MNVRVLLTLTNKAHGGDIQEGYDPQDQMRRKADGWS